MKLVAFFQSHLEPRHRVRLAWESGRRVWVCTVRVPFLEAGEEPNYVVFPLKLRLSLSTTFLS